MTSIPLFDSLTHPTLDGNWNKPEYNGLNSIERIQDEMTRFNVQWAFAVGMGPNIGGYNEEIYAQYINNQSSQLFPVALFDFSFLENWANIEDYTSNLKKLGYCGIKIHPRISGITYNDPRLVEIVRHSNAAGLVVMICTYNWECSIRSIDNSVENLVYLLDKVSDQKLILLHGGAVQLLQVAEIARHFPNVLVDLSFTLCKYEGSSIDQDIQFLFNTFDRKICVGSDSPEFSLADLRRRFEFFSKDIEAIKKENIAHRNLLNFIGLS